MFPLAADWNNYRDTWGDISYRDREVDEGERERTLETMNKTT